MAEIAAPDFTHYPTHDEMGALLRAWAAAFPQLAAMETIGRSPEGRELWVMTVTDRGVGRPEDKPALYLDGNSHPAEVLPSVVCLFTIWDLLSRFDQDERVTDLLHTRTVYVRPRVAPDGAESALTTAARFRSAPVPRPGVGLHPADVDGDGRIVQMRLRDPVGEWQVSARDPRLLMRRRVEDERQPRYRLMAEGLIEGPVTADPALAPPIVGLDSSHGFPHNWQPAARHPGAGPAPLFPPETRASADFVLAHPNIGAVVAYHTAGGFVAHLSSSARATQDQLGDLTGAYRDLTADYTRLTGEPAFPSDDVATGTAPSASFMAWVYSALGVYAWVPVLWNVWRAAGVERSPADFFAPPSEDDELALLRWNDTALGGSGFVPWHSFEHPQLGEVEIGGWDFMVTHQNPPERYIPGIARRHADWTYLLAQALPAVAIERTGMAALGDNRFTLAVRVVNTGYLPTNLSRQAIAVGRAAPVTVTVAGEGIEVISGPATQPIGHLDGYRIAPGPPWPGPTLPRRRGEAHFVLRAADGVESFVIRAASPQAGAVTRIAVIAEEVAAGAGFA